MGLHIKERMCYPSCGVLEKLLGKNREECIASKQMQGFSPWVQGCFL